MRGLRRPLRARARHLQLALDRDPRAQRVDAGAARQRQALDFPELVRGRVAPDMNVDGHLRKADDGASKSLRVNDAY